MTDPIADMLTRIRNASAVKKTDVVLPMSKIKFNIASILEKEKFVEKIEVINGNGSKVGAEKFDQLKIILKYKKGLPQQKRGDKKPAIKALKRISKPGLKLYATKDKLPVVLNHLGIAIISTPLGLMTNKEARRKNVGGEIICEIY